MTTKEAKTIASARGFSSVKDWMKENRKACKAFRSRMNCKGEDRARLQEFIRRLDNEHKEFCNFQ